MTRILIADDHRMVREGLKRILAEELPQSLFGQAGTVPETLELLRSQPWDLMLLDIFMPGGGGLEVLLQAVAICPQLPILVLSSAPEDQLALRVLQAGAAGYLNKQAAGEELLHAVRKVLTGSRYLSAKMAEQFLAECARPRQLQQRSLTDREFQVLQLIVAGKSLKEIGAELSLSPKTISTFHTRILQKLQLRNTVELIHYAIEHHLNERPTSTDLPSV